MSFTSWGLYPEEISTYLTSPTPMLLSMLVQVSTSHSSISAILNLYKEMKQQHIMTSNGEHETSTSIRNQTKHKDQAFGEATKSNHANHKVSQWQKEFRLSYGF